MVRRIRELDGVSVLGWDINRRWVEIFIMVMCVCRIGVEVGII